MADEVLCPMRTVRKDLAVMMPLEHSGMVRWYEERCAFLGINASSSTEMSGAVSLPAEEDVFEEVLLSVTASCHKQITCPDAPTGNYGCLHLFVVKL